MAAHEIWDYLPVTAVTPDYNYELDVTPQKVVTEIASKNQVTQLGDDDSEAVISFSDQSIFYVTLQWDNLKEDDAGTIFDFFNDPAKANGMARTFKWRDHGITDTHVYTVRFATNTINRDIKVAMLLGIATLKLKIIGRAP